jgi:hypothetical protein
MNVDRMLELNVDPIEKLANTFKDVVMVRSMVFVEGQPEERTCVTCPSSTSKKNGSHRS